MSNSRRFKRPRPRIHRPTKPRVLTRQQLEEWLENRDAGAPGVSMIDGYLAALVVCPRFIPPEEWLRPIVGNEVIEALEGSIEAAVRNTIFQRYNEIGSTLSGGPRRYAPIYMRTDDGTVLLEDFANGFYFGMQLAIDDWKPVISDPEIGLTMTALLGHCTTITSEDERLTLIGVQGVALLAESWRVVPDLVEMLHVRLAGSRNVEIR